MPPDADPGDASQACGDPSRPRPTGAERTRRYRGRLTAQQRMVSVALTREQIYKLAGKRYLAWDQDIEAAGFKVERVRIVSETVSLFINELDGNVFTTSGGVGKRPPQDTQRLPQRPIRRYGVRCVTYRFYLEAKMGRPDLDRFTTDEDVNRVFGQALCVIECRKENRPVVRLPKLKKRKDYFPAGFEDTYGLLQIPISLLVQ